jgi:hypothetical protein
MICDWFVNVGLLLDFIGAFLLGFIVKYVILPGKNLEKISSKMFEPLVVMDSIAVSPHLSPQLEPEEEKKVPKNPILHGLAWFLIAYGYYLQIVGNLLEFILCI